MIFSFQKDNTFIKSENSAAIYHFEINNDKIIISDNDPNNKDIESFTFKFENNKLLFYYNPTESISFEILLINTK